MDWEHIFSLSPEDVTEEEKDELYNMVTWFNIDSEKLNDKKSLHLLKLSQELLKYKGEQVEILLHKLDEIATQQGEEDVKRIESDNDAKSIKSRKSSSIEYENLEYKYMQLKEKYKKLVKINEKNINEITKFKKKIVTLEEENSRLEREMDVLNQDDNQSDVSETMKEQHKELINSLHNKNKHISQLLSDIEEIEKENSVLRDKVSNLRDELSTATKELNSMTENLKESKVHLNESSEIIKKLTAENETLHDEFREAVEEKQKYEQEMEEFSEEVNRRVDEWKQILEDRDRLIKELKTEKIPSSVHSSQSSIHQQENEELHISTLNKLLLEREKQLLELKSKLQQAVKDMEDTTETIKDLTDEKESNQLKINNLTESVTELKKKLKASHERCQSLQDDLTYTEQVVTSKSTDLKELINKLKQDGNNDLAEYLEQIQHLKNQNRLQERQIMDLVKAANKLQNTCDNYEQENEALRDRLGLTSEDTVNIRGVKSKQKLHKKELTTLTKRIDKLEKENLELRSKVHERNRTISSMQNQKPVDEVDYASDIDFHVLVEENEALRKGLHEILDSINLKKENTVREVKSETFEKLLRALDAKHISGWYHPAMRLQAELHNQEGINAELREQLRLTRLELKESEDSARHRSQTDEDSSNDLKSVLETCEMDHLNKIYTKLQNILTRLAVESETNNEIETKLLHYKQNFNEIQQQLLLLYNEYVEKTKHFNDEREKYENQIDSLKEANNINEEKVKFLTNEFSGEESITQECLNLTQSNVVLKRKINYLENEVKKLLLEANGFKSNLENARSSCITTINNLSTKNKSLSTLVEVLNNKLEISISSNKYEELQKNFDNLTIKYRTLLEDFTNITYSKREEFEMLEISNKNLEKDKLELKNKLVDLFEKVYSQNIDNVEKKIEELSKKLAQSEANEISERQRANHINNLYEVVKEQLQKSEEHSKQFVSEKDEVVKKYLHLQQQFHNLESKLNNYIDIESYQALQEKYNELLQQYDQSKVALNSEIEKKDGIERSLDSKRNLDLEDELLKLKHQIVDLQSISDDKAQVARLNIEIEKLHLENGTLNKKIKVLNEEFQQLVGEKNDIDLRLQNKISETSENEIRFKRRIELLKEILQFKKHQYLGCIPITSQEKFINNIKKAVQDKHQAFLLLYNAQNIKKESSILKEHYETEVKNLEKFLKINTGDVKDILNGLQEKRLIQFNESQYRRQLELKDTQLQHIFDRVKIQDEQIITLEEELFNFHKNFSESMPWIPEVDYNTILEKPEIKIVDPLPPTTIVLTKSKEIQTVETREDTSLPQEDQIVNLQAEIINLENEIVNKVQIIQQQKSKIAEHEMNISLFRKQLGDRQSQITFYERHILELQAKKEQPELGEMSQEVLSLKSSNKSLQDIVQDKDEEILRYQSLLKEDRDKHSLAATLMREELKILQQCLSDEKQKSLELKTALNEQHPGKAALEHYFAQVHCLEDELCELRTKVPALESQLQASREEAVRWRTLANDRLESMQKLGNDLEEIHRNEIAAYKKDSEKWRDEVVNLKEMIIKYRTGSGFSKINDVDVSRIIREKDDKIHELTVHLRQAKTEMKRSEKCDPETSQRITELELSKEQLTKELQALKKRFDQLLNRERSAREEVRELRGKLVRRSASISDRSDKSIKEQLQRKITSLENEILELKENLSKQIALNESHRVAVANDFEKWNKQKFFQQKAEKLKEKLKQKESDFEKLQQTCEGYRTLIERLEREKYNMENRIRNLKISNSPAMIHEIECLRLENMKLITENEALNGKLTMQQHQSGALGAAILQDKLEAQERKIAILEMSSKGSLEVRSELERLQNITSTLQKSNLSLEAENLDLKFDLEKFKKETPNLREQVVHLENYIAVLKNENIQKDTGEISSESSRSKQNKVSELERTILVLKRVVEKLQVENKRLVSGKRPRPERCSSSEQLRNDYQRLKEQYCESLQKITQLETELKTTKSTENLVISSKFEELDKVKEQLEQKTTLLDQVKVLLHRAAIKEKALLEEIAKLKGETEKDVEHESEEQ